MSDEYKIISEFCCCGKPMVTVMIGNAAYVMSQEEWNKVYGEIIRASGILRLIGIGLNQEKNVVKIRCLKWIISWFDWRIREYDSY